MMIKTTRGLTGNAARNTVFLHLLKVSIINCSHILKMTVGERHSVVNPQRWSCCVCQTDESVLACLSCPNVACGR